MGTRVSGSSRLLQHSSLSFRCDTGVSGDIHGDEGARAALYLSRLCTMGVCLFHPVPALGDIGRGQSYPDGLACVMSNGCSYRCSNIVSYSRQIVIF